MSFKKDSFRQYLILTGFDFEFDSTIDWLLLVYYLNLNVSHIDGLGLL